MTMLPFSTAAYSPAARTLLYLPSCSKLLAGAMIREEHMQQTALPMPSGALTPRLTGWRPKFRN